MAVVLRKRRNTADMRFRSRPLGLSAWTALFVAAFRQAPACLQSYASITDQAESQRKYIIDQRFLKLVRRSTACKRPYNSTGRNFCPEPSSPSTSDAYDRPLAGSIFSPASSARGRRTCACSVISDRGSSTPCTLPTRSP
jgi:hypothetical protein